MEMMSWMVCSQRKRVLIHGGSSGSGNPDDSRENPEKASPVGEAWRINEEEREEAMKRKSEEPS
eukprot:7581084-Karenia_brevis.AAC.1